MKFGIKNKFHRILNLAFRFESLISRDRRILRRQFLRNWLPETLSFRSVPFSSNLDRYISRYGRFEIETRIHVLLNSGSKIIPNHYFLLNFASKHKFFTESWIWHSDSNRSYLEIDTSSRAHSFAIGFLRLSTFDRYHFHQIWIDISRATGESKLRPEFTFYSIMHQKSSQIIIFS